MQAYEVFMVTHVYYRLWFGLRTMKQAIGAMVLLLRRYGCEWTVGQKKFTWDGSMFLAPVRP